MVKVTEDRSVKARACYLAVGVNLDGEREVLGLWFQETEGAKFWLQVLNDLKHRGVRDILICCVDGLTGFPEAIAAVFPETGVQTCIVHYADLRVMPTSGAVCWWWWAVRCWWGRHNQSASRKARSVSGGR